MIMGEFHMIPLKTNNYNHMKVRVFISLIAITFLWSSCATTMKYTWTKEDYQGKKYNKILVIVMSVTQQGRINGENSIVENLTKEGISATNSLQIFPPVESIENLSEDEIEKRIIDGNYDGVLVTSLIDINTQEVMEGGGTYYQPVTYGYRRTIRTGYVHMQEPEYYRQQDTYVFETQFYDVTKVTDKESVVWSGQSELTDPSSSESAANSYGKTLVKTLIESGVIK
jgi:hypothetical protein